MDSEENHVKASATVLAILGGCGVAAVTFGGFNEKIAIVLGAFAITLVVVSIYGLPVSRRLIVLPRALLYAPFLVILVTDALEQLGLSPLWSAVGLAIGSVLIFSALTLFQPQDVYSIFAVSTLAVSVAYSVFFFYPLIAGVDAWGNLALSSFITQTGHLTNAYFLIDPYYRAFPVMAIAASGFSLVSGVPLQPSYLIFPADLIVLQPLIAFLVAKKLFAGNRIAAMLSAFAVVLEPSIIQWMNEPIAESVAISMLLLSVLVLLLPRQSASKIAAILMLFLVIALHGSVAIIGVGLLLLLSRFYHQIARRFVSFVALMFFGYLLVSATIARITTGLIGYLSFILGTRPLPVSAQIYPASYGILFLWWGFPPAIAIAAILLLRRDKFLVWFSIAGISLLGLSFVVNVVAPSQGVDRYLGLGAWIDLAIVSGSSFSQGVTNIPTKWVLFIPLVFVVSLSAFLTPSLSPQVGLGYAQNAPTNFVDRTGLTWLGRNSGPMYTLSDVFSTSYLLYTRGSTQAAGLDLNFVTVPSPSTLSSGYVAFVRVNDFGLTDCRALGQFLHLELVYSNGCDVVISR
jgi:hypothetical protein